MASHADEHVGGEPAPQVIHVALSADDFFAMPMAVTITSMLSHLEPGHRLEVTVLDGGIKARNLARLRSMATSRCGIRIVKPENPRLDALIGQAHTFYPAAAWSRLLLVDLMPESVERVVYLDTDVVVQDSVSKLWEVDLHGAWLGAVGCGFPIGQLEHLRGIEIESGETRHYYNTGVLVFDLAAWRANQVLDRVFDVIAEHPEALFFADQDALNIALVDHWHTLPARWNQTVALRNHADGRPGVYPVDEAKEAAENPAVIHYTELGKPWHRGCTHPDQDRFFHYLDQTAWAGWRPTRFRDLRQLAGRALRKGRRLIGRRLRRRSAGAEAKSGQLVT